MIHYKSQEEWETLKDHSISVRNVTYTLHDTNDLRNVAQTTLLLFYKDLSRPQIVDN